MIPLFLLIVASFAAGPLPLPDGKAIDSVSYSFASPAGRPKGYGWLEVGSNGKVQYRHSTAPADRKLAVVTESSWEIPRPEAAALIRALIAGGVYDLPELSDPPGWGTGDRITLRSGRWWVHVGSTAIPETLLRHFRPYLERAHPALWKPVAPAPREKGQGPPRPALTRLQYSVRHTNELQTTLTLTRAGAVTYTLKKRGFAIALDGIGTFMQQPGTEQVSTVEWTIPAEDAAAILDGLAAGLFGMTDRSGAGLFALPQHDIEIAVGPWRTAFYPKHVPESVTKLVRPLLNLGEEKSNPAGRK